MRNPVGHLILAAIIWMCKLKARTEHSAQHRIRMCSEQCRIDGESRIVHEKSDAILKAMMVIDTRRTSTDDSANCSTSGQVLVQ